MFEKRKKSELKHLVLQTRSHQPEGGGGGTLLAAVELDAGEIVMFCSHDTPVEALASGAGLRIDELRTIGGGPWVMAQRLADGPVNIRLAGEEITVPLAPVEPAFFAGRNVALAVRNGERAELVLEWLRYHRDTHGMDAAMIFSRGRPGADKAFLSDLKAGLAKQKYKGFQVLVVEVDFPLGHMHLPQEAHPFCVPGAPGKDRMQIPDPDPWHSPMAGMILYEWARLRFLSQARAVANIDVFDFMADEKHTGQGSVFDRALASKSGYILLEGRHCYPWRIRDPKRPEITDHLCVQFDATRHRKRWAIAPAQLRPDATWRGTRIGRAMPEPGESQLFYRMMSLRHPSESVSLIVPKTSLVEQPRLMAMLGRHFKRYKPVLPPPEDMKLETNGRRAIVTTMKNEGPFILEWIAYHRAIGVDDFLVYTNDCTDGTDTLLELLQKKGIVQHRDNPFKGTGLKPQHAALAAAEKEGIISEAEWIVCMDVDEFIDIKVGDGTLDALFDALGEVNLISMTWRLFGNGDVHDYDPDFITRQFVRCAPEMARKPHQAWGFKTLYRNTGIFKKLGVHRPKGLKPQLWEHIRWVNGSGKQMQREMYRNAWRSTVASVGYDMVQLNHYAVRSAGSFLVKRDRGRVNHVDRDQGLAYWFRMNNNAEEERSIQRMIPKLQAEFDRLLADDEIRACHEATVAAHRKRIAELMATENYAKFYKELTGPRLEKLSRMHSFFGANVFLRGPGSIPDEIVARPLDQPFYFTVERGDTEH